MNRLLEKLDRTILFVIVYTIIFFVFFKTLGYTLPFVLAFIFASILQKPTRFLASKLRIKNSIASIITTLVFFSIIILLLTFGLTTLTTELIHLGKNSQIYFANNPQFLTKYIDILKNYYDNLDPALITALQNNLSNSIARISNLTAALVGGFASVLLNFLASIPYIIMVVLFTFLSTYFFTKDLSSARDKMLNFLPSENTSKIRNIFHETKRMLGGYALSYSIIILMTFLETLAGFSFLRVNYAVILSLLSAVFDVLPILGVGSVYVPVALIYILSKNYYVGFGILILYALVSIIRQVVEPKIVSSSLGIHPVPILAALFIGLKANGIAGMFFCVFLVVFYNIFRKVDLL
jgi:sporulation integral membrane protein YtvI